MKRICDESAQVIAANDESEFVFAVAVLLLLLDGSRAVLIDCHRLFKQVSQLKFMTFGSAV